MPVPQLSDTLLKDIRGLVESALQADAVPGAAVGLIHDGELAEFIGHGATDLESGETPTARSIARVASVTKTFTATAIMQLRDASLLALDDPLLLHVPEFTSAQANAAPLEGVTIRRMLTHHSGLSTEHPDLDWDTPDFPTLDYVLDTLDRIQVVIPQDTQWKYSNLAYCLLGEVISRLSGKPYIEYVLDEIVRPLGLENTAFDLSSEQQALKMTGYSPPLPGEAEKRVAPIGHLNGFSSAGQLHTNVEDLAKWIGFQLGDDDDSVLSSRSRAEMRRPVYIADDWSSGQGLGWRAARSGEHVYWNHGGAVHGFSTSVMFNPQTRTGVIVLVNMWPASRTADLALNIAKLLSGNPAKAPERAASTKPVEDASPGEFDGRYWAEPGLPVSVSGTREGIAFSGPAPGESSLHGPATLTPSGEDDSFTVVNGRGAGEVARFIRTDEGEIAGFTLGGFRYRKIG